jgi:GNAT superfamily N-acetyltransferase
MDIQACSNFFVQSFWEKVRSPKRACPHHPPSHADAHVGSLRYASCERACILKRGEREGRARAAATASKCNRKPVKRERYTQGTTTLDRSFRLSGAQRKALEEEQTRDMEERYGKLLGDRTLKSALVIMRDASGQIEGCCGIELAVADTDAFQPLKRSEGEKMLKGGLAALGGRARNELRGKPVQFVAASVLPEGYALIPVLSNLAVREESRGRGLARLLARRCEVISASWGFSELMLLVEVS